MDETNGMNERAELPSAEEMYAIEEDLRSVFDRVEAVSGTVARGAEWASPGDERGLLASREEIGNLAIFCHWMHVYGGEIADHAERIAARLAGLDVARLEHEAAATRGTEG